MRTGVDFSKHKHRVEIFKSEKNEIRVDHFQIENSRSQYIKFVNTDDILAVSGDYGNYVFCRPFHPSKDGRVSDHYWHEKLRTGSIQSFELQDLDFKSIIEELNAKLSDIEEDYDEDQITEARDYFDELLESAESEDKLSYESAVYREIDQPSFLDYDDIPYYKKENTQLRVVFDAFDEICKRIKEKD